MNNPLNNRVTEWHGTTVIVPQGTHVPQKVKKKIIKGLARPIWFMDHDGHYFPSCSLTDGL